MQTTLDWNTYSHLARTAAAEGCVLLRNEHAALPLRAGDTVSVFGRIQFDYYRSGTGSGGMVNAPYVRSVLDGLALYPEIHIYTPLLEACRSWVEKHPFDCGTGWGTEPWCQKEMPLADSLVQDAAAHSDAALVLIGRTAGEDRDNSASPGSYYLTDAEKEMLRKVCSAFSRTIVVLNTGNILDMSWVDEFQPSAVLFIWQGGMEGGAGAADVLCGAVSPCGKLADTIAFSFDDYPSSKNFGSETVNYYQEDIYVGYRYFETFTKDRVRYPFGFGLSYTSFSIRADLRQEEASGVPKLIVTACVTNTGKAPGKEVVQVYVDAPQGKLGKPLRSLCAFAKTDCLQPGQSQVLTLEIERDALASFDDSGVTGHKSCFVLEEGVYRLFVGADVRSAALAGSFSVSSLTVTEQLCEALAPVRPFQRLHPNPETMCAEYEPAPLRTCDPAKRRLSALPSCPPFTGDQGWKLQDVHAGRVSLSEFLAQLTDEDLMHMVRGEGMCSPKVTPGTAAAFGGITKRLQGFGIPAGCCSDGPSGIRMDCGTAAFSLPNGTLLACTFNTPLVTSLFEMEGLELRSNRIDALLGPGINIHRNPLNGRNFEYHSEDPFLTGRMAQAQALGMDRAGVSGTLKHFCANNQEYHRHTADSVVSARALREIYLKPFEMCVRDGHIRSIMTSYGPLNGIWTAGNYDLNTTVLRSEWGFSGMVMTDWWAKANNEGSAPDNKNLAAMIRAQNDVFMVTADAQRYRDNLGASLKNGTLTRAELARCAGHICGFLMASPAFEALTGSFTPVVQINRPDEGCDTAAEILAHVEVGEDTVFPLEGYPATAGSAFVLSLTFESEGQYRIALSASTESSEHAQMAVTLSFDGTMFLTCSWHGGCSEPSAISREREVRGTTHYLKFYFSHTGLHLHALHIQKTGTL